MGNIFQPHKKRRTASKKMKPLKAIPQAKSIVKKYEGNILWEDTAQAIWQSGICYFIKHNNHGLELNTNDGKYINILFDWSTDEYTVKIFNNEDDLSKPTKTYIRLDIVDLEWNKWVGSD